MVFDMAGKDGESWQHLQLCLISRALLPFGQAVLYRDCNLLAPTTSTRNKSAVSSCISAKRTVLFFEHLLPNLDTSRAKLFSSLSLNLGSHGSPPSWVLRQFEELLRIFSESRATLTVLVGQKVLTGELVSMVQSTQAFFRVHIEVPKIALNDYSYSGSFYELLALREKSKTGKSLLCTIWTLSDPPMPGYNPEAHGTQRVVTIKGPLGATDWSLSLRSWQRQFRIGLYVCNSCLARRMPTPSLPSQNSSKFGQSPYHQQALPAGMQLASGSFCALPICPIRLSGSNFTSLQHVYRRVICFSFCRRPNGRPPFDASSGFFAARPVCELRPKASCSF